MRTPLRSVQSPRKWMGVLVRGGRRPERVGGVVSHHLLECVECNARGWRKPTPFRYTPHMQRDDEKLLRQLSLVSYLLSRERPSTSVEIARSVEGYAFMAADTFTRRFHSDRRDLLDRAGINICTSRHLGDEGEEAYYLTRKSRPSHLVGPSAVSYTHLRAPET